MRSIVVPVNFTAKSVNAARYAADLALATGAELHLIHVLQAPATVKEKPLPYYVWREMRDGSYTRLKDLRDKLAGRTGGKVSVATTLETGDVASKLQDFCRLRQPWLVIMGKGAMYHLPYPVLSIPENEGFLGIRKIAVACDLEDIFSGIAEVLPFLNDLHELLGAHLELIHVIPDGEQNTEGVRLEFIAWKKQVADLEPELHFVRQSRIEEGIGQFLQDHGADWLLVLPKKYAVLQFHKSRAKQIELHCAVPVMSLHE
jgi:nucleotide-binding universal stress UspA family protein